MLVNLPIPGGAQIFYGYLFDIIAFNIIATDEFYNNNFDLSEPVALNDIFKSQGYESKYFLNNIGDIAVYFLAYPILSMVSLIFGKCKCKPAQKIHKWMNSRLVWNSWYALVEESYLILVVAAMIQLY